MQSEELGSIKNVNLEELAKLAEMAREPKSWLFAIITSGKGGIAIFTLVMMFLNLTQPHTNYSQELPKERCVSFFDTVADAALSRSSDMVAYNYDGGMASVRVCTSDPGYWNSKLGDSAYDPFAYGINERGCTDVNSSSIVCSYQNSKGIPPTYVSCAQLHTAANNWIYGITVTSDGNTSFSSSSPSICSLQVQYVAIDPPLPPCNGTVLSFQRTNTNVQVFLSVLVAVPVLAFLVQSVITINYTYNLSKPALEMEASQGEAQCCNCPSLTVQSMAYGMEGAPGSLLQFYYLVQRHRGKDDRYVPQIRLTTAQLVASVFQQLLEMSGLAVALWGCTAVSIRSSWKMILYVVLCPLKGGLALFAIYSWLTSKPKAEESVLPGGFLATPSQQYEQYAAEEALL